MQYSYSYYMPTNHFYRRSKQRMGYRKSEQVRKRIQTSSIHELARRANFMLLFSIHGRPGRHPDIEIRYYFNWNIVINNRTKKILTIYPESKRPVPSEKEFGDRRLRKLIYDFMFRPNSKVARAAFA